jgi:hypothetical protein
MVGVAADPLLGLFPLSHSCLFALAKHFVRGLSLLFGYAVVAAIMGSLKVRIWLSKH